MDRLTIFEEKWYCKMGQEYVLPERELSPLYRHQLQTEQAYLSEDSENILEILGTHGCELYPDLEVRVWEEVKGGKIKAGSEVMLSQLTPSCGM